MVDTLLLKQAQRSILVTKETLLQELALARKENRNSDAYLINSKLEQYGWNEPPETSVTPEISEQLTKDQYWVLIKVLAKLHPPKVKAQANYKSKVVVNSKLNPLYRELKLLIQTLKKANVTPSGETAHHELKATETDLLIGQQIHLAQTDILIFIDRLIQHGEELGDPENTFVMALCDCGFIGALQDYLKIQGCNMQGAAILLKMLERVSCSGA